MTEQPNRPNATPTEDQTRSVRPVIEHALTVYGYGPDIARALIDRLIAENGGQ
jgi:hypothetical protein